MTATLYIGTDHASWLGTMGEPLFVSRRTLTGRKTFPRAVAPWALDSGGFTELSMYGEWTVDETAYAADVRRFADQVGNLEWAAPMDWMCEPSMLAKTGRSVDEHQTRTVHNLLYLRDLAPDLPIIPVIQGWTRDDYLRCVDLYDRVGVDLTAEPLVGIGSVCRRDSDAFIGTAVRAVTDLGISVHGFGIRGSAYTRLAHVLTSADSMAWSYAARMAGVALPGCKHRRCHHCQRYARLWRDRLVAAVHPELAFT